MKKCFGIVGFLILLYNVAGQSNFITNIENRTSQNLNGKWKYIVDQYETGNIGFAPLYKNIKQKGIHERVEYNFDYSATLWVPGSWNAQKEALYYYEGSIWYKRSFDFKRKIKNSRVFIYIGAANYKTKYSLNGEMIGEHEGGFTPFSFEVTNYIKEKDNFIIIGVSNRREKENIPGPVTDWYNYGGIIRDVKIIEVPQTYIDDYIILLNKPSLKSKQRIIQGNISLNGSTFPIKAYIEIPELSIRHEIMISENGIGNFSFTTSKLELWSPENPKLYTVKIIAGKDIISDRIGFRVIETRGNKILLNGKPVFLKGICIHDENPLRHDRANSIDDARLVLTWAKELGCNFLRLAHYPHQENIIRLADEMGFMLWEELPLYWGIDWNNDHVLNKAKEQFSELIRRDKNRACTIIWSIANETGPGDARNRFLTEVAHHVKSLDPERLISGALKKDHYRSDDTSSTYIVSDPIADVFDIVSFNEYQGWYDGPPELCKTKNFIIGYNKPVIISEFGGGALQGFYSDSLEIWSEDFQELIYKENIEMFKRVPGLAGLAPWILADFQSPLRQLPYIQDGWNRKGLISEKGVKKKAFYVLQEYYKKVDKEWLEY